MAPDRRPTRCLGRCCHQSAAARWDGIERGADHGLRHPSDGANTIASNPRLCPGARVEGGDVLAFRWRRPPVIADVGGREHDLPSGSTSPRPCWRAPIATNVAARSCARVTSGFMMACTSDPDVVSGCIALGAQFVSVLVALSRSRILVLCHPRSRKGLEVLDDVISNEVMVKTVPSSRSDLLGR